MNEISRREFLAAAAAAGTLSTLSPKDALAQAATRALVENDAIKKDKAAAMEYHSERPLTASVQAHHHDFDVTPNDRMFIRNNLLTPSLNLQTHRLTINGAVERELSLSVMDLPKQFKPVVVQGMLECAGSGRTAFLPRPSGTPWTVTGGMGCPEWSGVRLGDVLRAAGIKAGAAHVAGRGADPGAVETAAPVIRSIPLAKALDENTLIAWAMNGEPLPFVHGYPLRLVVPGWVGSASTKWLNTLTVLDAPFKGTYMTGSYVMPRVAVVPGEKMPADVVSTEAWPVKSMITSPAPNARIKLNATGPIVVRGRAWVGEGSIDRVEVSSDEGRTWRRAELRKPRHKYAWSTFTYEHKPERPGYVTFLARAWDDRGNAQPAVSAWNPLGYFWNGWHRVGVMVEA